MTENQDSARELPLAEAINPARSGPRPAVIFSARALFPETDTPGDAAAVWPLLVPMLANGDRRWRREAFPDPVIIEFARELSAEYPVWVLSDPARAAIDVRMMRGHDLRAVRQTVVQSPERHAQAEAAVRIVRTSAVLGALVVAEQVEGISRWVSDELREAGVPRAFWNVTPERGVDRDDLDAIRAILADLAIQIAAVRRGMAFPPGPLPECVAAEVLIAKRDLESSPFTGWAAIVLRLQLSVRELDPKLILALGSKFGALRVIRAGVRLPEPVNELIRAAEGESFSTCDTCGRPGEPDFNRAWVSTRCNLHPSSSPSRRRAE